MHLHKGRQGFEPSARKPTATVGSGVREIRIREDGGAFRIPFVAQLAGAIVVLHAFEKEAQKTPRRDLDLAKDRQRAFTDIKAKGKKR